MDLLRAGRSLRALRVRRELRQQDLAELAGLSRSKVARIEAGQAMRVPIGDLVAVAARLGADVDLRVRWRGEGLDRLLDAAHAVLVNDCAELLRRLGWEVVLEATFAVGAERGSVDILAWHEPSRTLLIVEVKSVVPDAQAMLAAHDRKVRLARRIGLDRGWRAEHVAKLLVIGDTSLARSRIRRLGASFELAYPLRGWAARRWLAAPADAGDPGPVKRSVAALLFLPYSHGMGGMGNVVPRQRVRKRDRLGRSGSTSTH